MGLYTNIDRILPTNSFMLVPRGGVGLGLAVIKRYVKPVANEPRHKKTCSDFFVVLYIDNTLIRGSVMGPKWGMKFNAKKCYVLSSRNKSSYFYAIDDHILQQVQNNPYLGITFSDDLKWKTHISRVWWGKLSSECGASCLLNGASCLLSVGRVVLGRVFFGASCLGASCLWGELSVIPQEEYRRDSEAVVA